MEDDEKTLETRLITLKQEHQDLDSAISALSDQAPFNHLQIQRLKKQKLFIKDEITRIEDELYPDIIA